MEEQPATYAETLRAAIDAAGSSRRKLSAELAEETGNSKESEYRALGKYLAAPKPDKTPEEPDPERAAVLAVLLGEHRLALVSSVTERRQRRREGVEAQVAQNTVAIDALREAVAILLAQVVALGAVVPALPADALPPTAQDTDS